ncbi:MAG: hypothetical protein ABIB79_00440, partial [archaeon]
SMSFAEFDNDKKKNELVVGGSSDLYGYFSNGSSYWSDYTGSSRPESIETYDLNNDFIDEIISTWTGGGGRIYIHNSTGSVIWMNSSLDSLGGVASVDIDNDGIYDRLFVASGEYGDEKVFCYNSSDGNTWFNFKNISLSGDSWELEAGDINGNGIKDGFVITEATRGAKVFYDNCTQKFNMTHSSGSVTFADIDRDGLKDEIVIGRTLSSSPDLYAYYNNGTLIWSQDIGPDVGDNPWLHETITADLDNDGFEDEIITSANERMYAVDHNGAVLWEFADDDYIKDMISIVAEDINDDGFPEVFAGGVDDIVWVLDNNGSLLYDFGPGYGNIGYAEHYGSEPSIDSADVNNDGIKDIGFITADGYAFIIQDVSCIAEFNDSQNYTMEWNQTAKVWEFNRTFADVGLYNYNITCEKGGYETQVRNSTMNISENEPPKIITVYNETIKDNTPLGIALSAPNAGPASTELEIKFSVYDINGWNTINESSAYLNISMVEEELRESYTCSIVPGEVWDTTYANVTCNVTMWWWDGPTNSSDQYNIQVYIEDTQGGQAVNTSTIFEVASKTGFDLFDEAGRDPPSFDFINVQVGGTNIKADNYLWINNTGNTLINYLEVNATNLTGDNNPNYWIAAEYFRMGNDTGCGGAQLKDHSNVTINGSVESGNYTIGDGTAQEQVYLCIANVPTGLPGQDYSAEELWEINYKFVFIYPFLKILAVSITFKRKKNKNIKKDKLIKVLIVLQKELKEEYSTEKKEIIDIIIGELKSKYYINRREVLELVKQKESVEIPITIFSKELGGLEVVVKYMKENLGMTYSEIAREIGRDERTVWVAYHKAVEKQKAPIKPKETDIELRIEVFKDRELTVLESVIMYLKKKEMKYSEIGELLDRDQRNVWTIYSRAKKKLEVNK